MPLFIGSNYKVEATKYNIVLYCKPEVDKIKSEQAKDRLRKRYGDDVKFKSDEDLLDPEKGWVTLGYFSNIANSLSYCIIHEIEVSELKDLETVVNRVKEVESNILKALEKVDELKLKEVMKPDEKTEVDE